MSESRVLAEIEAAASHYRICVLPRNPKKLYCSVWSMADPSYHVGVIWRQNTGGFQKGHSFIRLGMSGQADFTGWLFKTGQRIEIEAKSQKGELSPSQVSFHALAQATGLLRGTVRSYDDACDLFQSWGLKCSK